MAGETKTRTKALALRCGHNLTVPYWRKLKRDFQGGNGGLRTRVILIQVSAVWPSLDLLENASVGRVINGVWITPVLQEGSLLASPGCCVLHQVQVSGRREILCSLRALLERGFWGEGVRKEPEWGMETEEEKTSGFSKCSSTETKTFLQGCVGIMQNLVVNGLRTSLKNKKKKPQ